MSGRTVLFLLTALALLFSGCSSPDVLPSQLRAVPPAAAESIVTHYLAKYKAEFQLEPRPQGGTQAIGEAYLRRCQPGPEPRAFQSSIVYDRQDRILAELFDEGRRTWVPLARISPYLLDAVIATEDGSFKHLARP